MHVRLPAPGFSPVASRAGINIRPWSSLPSPTPMGDGRAGSFFDTPSRFSMMTWPAQGAEGATVFRSDSSKPVLLSKTGRGQVDGGEAGICCKSKATWARGAVVVIWMIDAAQDSGLHRWNQLVTSLDVK
jgi:hypothetical protein